VRFPYRPYAVQPTPAQPGVSIVYRPRIPIHVIGSLGNLGLFGLLDTGADETVLPAFLVERIGVEVDPGAEAQFRGVGGQIVTVSYARVQLEVGKAHQSYRWPAKVAFLQGSNMAILGHAGFLQYFTATFNGQRRHVTLTANSTLPAEHRP
jgi:hypothetical protein